MPSLKTIRKRIGSVKSTQKITRAMKMVAGARLARSQARITALRPYAVKTAEVLQEVARSMVQDASRDDADTPLHKLLERREEKKVLYLVISADRGLAGAFNANIAKATLRSWREKEAAGAEVSFVTVGRKGREQVARRGGKVLHDFTRVFESVDLEKARTIALWLTARYRRRDFDAIYVVYSEFKSAITQTAKVDKLLPLPLPSEDDARDAAGATTGSAGATNATAASSNSGKKEQDQAPTEYIFEPGRDQLLERLLPMYLEISILRGLYESQASFFGAQMTAMDAATRNAKDLIGRLTLVYNRARQAAITKELMEIIGGAEALKE
jgi:F-type H+-transporting ATPase subunit gamma